LYSGPKLENYELKIKIVIISYYSN
jgi:hypothetical protein